MKVIFLDIDGVLALFDNDEISYEAAHQFNKICLNNLITLVKNTGAKIVISSTWRKHKGKDTPLWDILVKQLDAVGLEIYDVTPDTFYFTSQVFVGKFGWVKFSLRGHEIQKWLDSHPEVEKIVILDDDSDMAHLISFLVQTNFDDGLQEENVKQAENILNTDFYCEICGEKLKYSDVYDLTLDKNICRSCVNTILETFSDSD